MHRPDLVSLIAAAAVAFLLLGVGEVAGQTPAESTWTPPRTANGRPDLQGVWLSNSATPLERPAALAGRARLTDEEVAVLQSRAERIFSAGRSAYAAGDTAFLAALDDVETYESPNSTSSSNGMVEREFDNRTSLVVDPTDGQIPSASSIARARQAAVATGWAQKTGPEDLNNIHRCITTGVPRLGGNFGAGPYSYYQLVQTPDYVVVLMEAFHDARIIPMDGRSHVAESIRQWNGDSRGHWEGDTLVVETRNFSSDSYFRGATDNLHLVETFTRTARDTLTYRMTFTDATTWSTPWTAEMPLKRRDQAIYEFACHEGNHPMEGMLSTARRVDDRLTAP